MREASVNGADDAHCSLLASKTMKEFIANGKEFAEWFANLPKGMQKPFYWRPETWVRMGGKV